MRTKRIVVVPYDPEWNAAFQELKAYFFNILGSGVLAVEHVGSTAVPGLSAKPIVDVDVVIRDDGCFPEVKARLEAAGYAHEGDLGIAGREAFAYASTALMAHHLYVCPHGSAELKRHLLFRDYLRAHAAERERYGAIKVRAARASPTNIDAYLAEKAPYIKKIHAKLGL